jgi:phosphohistidine phosphatase SixA
MQLTKLLSVIVLSVAQALSGASLVNALRSGGYVIVMRHASSPRETPDKQTANPDNVKLERQLDSAGRAAATAMGQALHDLRDTCGVERLLLSPAQPPPTAMGQALHDLKIPIGEVLTSPTYRAMETVRLAQLPNSRPHEELGDGGQSMQGASDAQAAWLRNTVSRAPKGTNTIIVTHMPNIARAFPQWGAVADGEAVVLRPDGQGGGTVVGRIKIDEWPRLR